MNKEDVLSTKQSQYDPVVTLAIVSYNHEKFIEEALMSVLNQDYPNLDVIVIDDASTDRSGQIAQNFVQRHHLTWQLWLNTNNKGLCHSLNKVLQTAYGSFLFVLAADDYMAPDRVSALVRRAVTLPNETAVIYSDCLIVDANKQLVAPSYIEYYAPDQKHLPQGIVLKELLQQNFICNTAVLTRIDSLKEIGGFDERLVLEDYSTWVKLADKGYEFAAISEKNFTYRLLSNSTLRKMGVRYYEDLFIIYSELIHRKEPALRKLLKKKIAFCCKHAYYLDSTHVAQMFRFFFQHFGFNVKLFWLYLLYNAGIRGTTYRSIKL